MYGGIKISLDFALKDFYRKKDITIPYVLINTLIFALTVFIIYFTSSIGLNNVFGYNFSNEFFFSGGISIIYIDFNSFILILTCILAFSVVMVISSTLVVSKKRDIAIMKAVGSLPHRLYWMYLTEVYIIFFIGFILGLILGLVIYGIVALAMFLMGSVIVFFIDFIYIPFLLIACVLGIYFIPGYLLRKIGRKKIISTFSKDIPYEYDASKKLSLIPRWISSISVKFRISVINSIRRKGEFFRYMTVFTIISLIIITLGLGTIVLGNSSQQWVAKSQGENIIAIGHEDVLQNYSLMYGMFSDPSYAVRDTDINFLSPDYLFNCTNIDDIANMTEILQVDMRIISFLDCEEMNGYVYSESGAAIMVGQNRRGSFPMMGINRESLIQNFEIEGHVFSESERNTHVFIGDGMGYNFFDAALAQRIRFIDYGLEFGISGVAIDTFYSGHAGYMDLSYFQNFLNISNQDVNLVICKLRGELSTSLVNDLNSIIFTNLGSDFSYLSLDPVFMQNHASILMLTLYPALLIVVLAAFSLLALYHYQKGGIVEKAKDFLIMRAIGAKNKVLKQVLFLESLYVIIPSLILSLGIGMILNSLVIFDRVYLPNLAIPFLILGLLLLAYLLFDFLSIIPITKKINSFCIKDFEVY